MGAADTNINQINSSLSTRMQLYVSSVKSGSKAVERCGAIQSWTITESTTLTRIAEVGLGRYLEIVQGLVQTSISVSSIGFSQRRLLQHLGQGFYTLQAQHKPFMLIEKEQMAGTDQWVQIAFHGCRLENSSHTVSTPDQAITITYDGSIQVTYVSVLTGINWIDLPGASDLATTADADGVDATSVATWTPALAEWE